jgi:hypothetical protein
MFIFDAAESKLEIASTGLFIGLVLGVIMGRFSQIFLPDVLHDPVATDTQAKAESLDIQAHRTKIESPIIP